MSKRFHGCVFLRRINAQIQEPKILAAALLLTFAHSAVADECKDALIPDVVNVKYNRAIAMSLLRIMSDEQISKHSKSTALVATGYGSFNSARDNASRSTWFSKEDYALNEQEALNLVIANVPLEARLKFYDCVRKDREIQLQVRNLDTSFVFRVVRGGGATSPNRLRLAWSTSDPELTAKLKKEVPSIGRTGAYVDVPYYKFSAEKGISITVNDRTIFGGSDGIAADTLSVPALPKVKPRVITDEMHSLPLKVTMHFAQVGNLCYTVNVVGEAINGDATECSLSREGWAGSYLGHVQEITLDWDRTAMRSFGSPFEMLSDEELSFEYTCYYSGSGATYTAKRGQKCGNEAGEPLLQTFSMKLTGTMSKAFKARYKCTGENTVGPVADGGVCSVAGWRGIGMIAPEVDTDPK